MSNPETWRIWEGRVVDGKFPLRQWLGGSERSAVFLTEGLRQASAKAVIKLIAADAEAERQLSRWRAAANLAHPHLIRIFETGRSELDDTPLLYVVMEYAEEDLSQILPQRPLTASEVSELLPPLLDALSYLHAHGFVHSRIKPSNVLAVGDQLKLSADQVASASEPSSALRRRDVYDAPETAAGIVSPAGDVWSVGVTLVAAVTQNVSFVDESSPGDPRLPANIPQPFDGIARECLHLDPRRRCSISDIVARLQPQARSVPAEPEAPEPAGHSVNRMPIAAVALVALVLVGVAVFHSRGKNATPASDTTQLSTPPAAAASTPPVHAADQQPKKAVAAQSGVLRQVLPDVPQSAMRTIRGTIKIRVRVEVGPTGKVTAARLVSTGPSRYFANLALNAAQRWEFTPLEASGQPAPSAWNLQFRFRRTSTEASAERATAR